MKEIKMRFFDTKFECMLYLNAVEHGKFFGVSPRLMLEGGNPNLSEAMLSTTLKDKNGVEIYEGDILSKSDFYGDIRGTMIVRYGQGTFDSGIYTYIGFYLERLDGKQDEDTSFATDEHRQFYTNIGNIHQNPDLLK